MITKQQVEESHALLLQIINQAMARGLFNNLEDMPKILQAVELVRELFANWQSSMLREDSLTLQVSELASTIVDQEHAIEELQRQIH